MLENGFIKLHRSLVNWEWYRDANTSRLFIHLLLVANYDTQKWRGVEVLRGQKISSYGMLAQELGLSVQNIRTAVKHLISTGELTHQSTAEYGIFTVVNYDKYQGLTYDTTLDQQSTNSQPTVNQQQRKKANKAKNEKKEKEIQHSDAWTSFVEMRKKIKKPMSDRAIEMALGELEKLAPGNIDKQVAILDQSTFHCWQGLFELKQQLSDSKPADAVHELTPEEVEHIRKLRA